jgi:hypothetical protein
MMYRILRDITVAGTRPARPAQPQKTAPGWVGALVLAAIVTGCAYEAPWVTLSVVASAVVVTGAMVFYIQCMKPRYHQVNDRKRYQR